MTMDMASDNNQIPSFIDLMKKNEPVSSPANDLLYDPHAWQWGFVGVTVEIQKSRDSIDERVIKWENVVWHHFNITGDPDSHDGSVTNCPMCRSQGDLNIKSYHHEVTQ